MTSLLPEPIRRALELAVQAPSSHNSQPWRFRVREAEIELWADTSRQLHVVDPDARELTISCGAALFNLVCATRCGTRRGCSKLSRLR